jgi:S1-C subfamily serine protease
MKMRGISGAVAALALWLVWAPGAELAAETLQFDTMEGIGVSKRETPGPAKTGAAAQGAESRRKLAATDIYAQSAPGVVIITMSLEGQTVAHGSGFIVKPNGYILTNHHVVDQGALAEWGYQADCRVHLGDGRAFPARIVKQDPELDLALLKISADGLPALKLGDAAGGQVGDRIYVIGTPLRLEFSTSMIDGIISGMDRDQGRIQTSAILHGGNSGGPAFNDRGEVVGVAVAVAMGGETQIVTIDSRPMELPVVTAKAGISYLVPINYAKNLLNLMY